MTGVSNPRLPICRECGDEKQPQNLDDAGHCGWCADKFETEELAAKRAEALADFRHFSRGWFRDQRDRATAIIDAAERARELLGPAFYAEALIADSEPYFSAERDSRVSP